MRTAPNARLLLVLDQRRLSLSGALSLTVPPPPLRRRLRPPALGPAPPLARLAALLGPLHRARFPQAPLPLLSHARSWLRPARPPAAVRLPYALPLPKLHPQSCRYAVPLSLYCYGLRDTTPSYAIIFLNIIPLVTFILSLILRMETLQIGSKAGSLKIAGVLLSVGGTMLISLYKGRAVHLWNSIQQHHKEARVEVASNQLRGTIFLAGSSLTFACWYLIQSKVLEVYPYKYWSSMVTCLIGGFQTALLGIILRRDKDAWKLGWDLQLVTIVYSGALATAARYSLNSWAVAERGPAYPPMFSPLALVFTAVLDSIFIGDDITVGSLLGTTMVIAGLYLFLWAKAKEVPGK